VYGDFVMEVDHAVDRVLRALKRKGVYEDTLVLFSSDHGAASYAGNILEATPGQIRLLEKQGHYSSGPHRGYKFTVYEGGLRVPLIAHWPSAIKPGGECDELVGLCDLMATFAELSGSELKADKACDSISFAGLLRDPNAAGRRKNLVMQSIGPFVVRNGDWKLCLCPGSGSTGKYGNVPASEDAWRKAIDKLGKSPNWADLTGPPFVQLFHLANDPHEDVNLASQEPDRASDIVALLRRQIEQGRSTPGPALSHDHKNMNIIQRLPEFVRKQLKRETP
jgi:arylsulfatase A-like enzyme